ncbi:MAG: A/G-specific adenine glycosylase [Alphaproteobacteria bacterium]|nr:A/G-specific adenine glycosylase [Alphaproteobacteria bacterium]
MPLISQQITDWYLLHGRTLPWRFQGGAHPNPYYVWISEIMLQQTTVKTVLSYFDKFVKKYPTVFDLANAPIDEVLLIWQGMGYYTRARKLHECAKVIVEQYHGKIPDNREELLKLPGIGPYTSASISALAFNLPESAVDGNVIRVITRYFAMSEPTNQIIDLIDEHARQIASTATCPADYASAIMDLGATVCTPKNPKCVDCPLVENCLAKKQKQIEIIPNVVKMKRGKRKGFVFIIKNKKNEIFIRKRTEQGLLNGLYEFPWNTDLTNPFNEKASGIKVKHVFTHFDLSLELIFVQNEKPPFTDGFFIPIKNLPKFAFSTLMNKVKREFL